MKKFCPARPRLLLVALALFLASPCAHAQADEAALRTSELALFGEIQLVNPAYGPSSRDLGLTVGFNYTHFFHTPVLPSFELRATYAGKGPVAGEKTALAGIRLDLRLHRLGRLHPYGNFLVGPGEIDFTNPSPTSQGLYSHDNSTVYNYGFGLNVDLARSLALQAEFQRQNWNTGDAVNPLLFHPTALNLGLRFRIPFKPTSSAEPHPVNPYPRLTYSFHTQ